MDSGWRTCGEPGEEVIGGFLSLFIIDASLDEREWVRERSFILRLSCVGPPFFTSLITTP